jgi:hypothetical protein
VTDNTAASIGPPGQDDLELVARSHHRPRRHAELPDLHAGPVVRAEDGVAGEAAEEAVLDHLARAAAAFLPGLEDEVQRAVEVAMPGEVLGGCQQHGGVAVVTAGVHLSGMPRSMLEGVLLLQGQGVHVRAQADGARAGALAQGPDQSGAADSGGDFVTPAGEFLRDHLRRAMLLEAQFGMGVDVPPYGSDLRLQVQNSLCQQHDRTPSFVSC